jgi:hypothetical protein
MFPPAGGDSGHVELEVTAGSEPDPLHIELPPGTTVLAVALNGLMVIDGEFRHAALLSVLDEGSTADAEAEEVSP